MLSVTREFAYVICKYVSTAAITGKNMCLLNKIFQKFMMDDCNYRYYDLVMVCVSVEVNVVSISIVGNIKTAFHWSQR